MPSRPPFLQDFCKKAQWRAKKLRERGSNTARPTEKGRGGLPIGSRLGRFRRDLQTSSLCFVPIRSIRSVSSCRFGRFRRDLQTSSWCFVPIRSIRSVSSCRVVPIRSIRSISSCRVVPKSRRKHKKKPDPSIGESGAAIAIRRALLTFC